MNRQLLFFFLLSLVPSTVGQLSYSCNLNLFSQQPAQLCPEILAVPESVSGRLQLAITASSFYDTYVCIMYDMQPAVDKVAFWNEGYCPGGFFSFSGTSSCPKNNSAVCECPKTTAASTAAFEAPSDHTGNSFQSYFGTVHTPAVTNTYILSVPKPTKYFVPRTVLPQDELAGGGYYIAVGISDLDNTFFGKNRYCVSPVSLTITNTTSFCPEGQAGPTCAPVLEVTSPAPQSNLLGLPSIFVDGDYTTSFSLPPSSWTFYSFALNQDLVPSWKLRTVWNQPAAGASKANPVVTYIRYGGVPFDQASPVKLVAYDIKTPAKSYSNSTITFPDPLPGRYYIGFSNPSTTVVTGVFAVSTQTCSKPGRYGSGCNIKFQSKLNGQVTSQTPSYIRFNATNNIMVSVSTLALSAPAMYLGAGFVPNATHYSVSANTGDKVNRIIAATPLPVEWVVAIVADLQETIDFNVWTNTVCYNNCMVKGVQRGYCPGGNDTLVQFDPTGVCKCTAKGANNKTTYENFGCQYENNHDFGLEYIILIAVGGAIILAIFIGVPLYCWIYRAKSKTSGYTQL